MAYGRVVTFRIEAFKRACLARCFWMYTACIVCVKASIRAFVSLCCACAICSSNLACRAIYHKFLPSLISRKFGHVREALVRQRSKHPRSMANMLPLLSLLSDLTPLLLELSLLRLQLGSARKLVGARMTFHEAAAQTDPLGELHGSGKEQRVSIHFPLCKRLGALTSST